ncbi:hypothetical protein GCM10011390_09100 [Aureimonas endophytica]|uniref:Uncharacterized protein n=1 Tax=Aureimonas endophytica TaxID=2027858 RepID=A0A917E0T0_9HYPH|nr:ribonuclease T2 [Aureimonas endophytica]GGD92556.1 hypothetical protein GCM10011390_09100 [Aureimonas endophytica]
MPRLCAALFLFGLLLPLGAAGAQESEVSRPSTRNVLAISWQPAFCEGQSRKPECRSQTADRADGRRFSLHGLWPQPRSREYCGPAAPLKEQTKTGGWKSLPEPQLSAATKARLDDAMPGTQSLLERHEWARHGTCFGLDAEGYFGRAIALLDAVNGSAVAELFAARIGQNLSTEEIRAAFDKAFGPGAGERVRVSCRDDGSRRLIDELTIGLSGEIAERPDIAALIAGSRPTKPGCPGGIVDPVGLQ